MTGRMLTVESTGGSAALYRVINILALFDIELTALNCDRQAETLAIRLRLNAPERLLGLCLARLRALPCVAHATLETPPLEA